MYKKNIILTLLFLLNLAFVLNAKAQNPIDYQQIDTSSAKLIDLEKKFIKTENPEESEKLKEQIKDEANKNLFLLVNGNITSASAIFVCKKLKPNFECFDITPEDISQIGTGKNVKTISGKIEDIKSFINPEYPATTFQFYLATLPITKITPVTIDTSLKPLLAGKKEKLLFAIVKGKGDSLYKEYVWLIRP